MQEQNYSSLLSDAFKNPLAKPSIVKNKMTTLAEKNKSDLKERKLPDFLRTPTADELTEIRQWAIDYKKFHTKASKREVRKATQQHFNIRIFR